MGTITDWCDCSYYFNDMETWSWAYFAKLEHDTLSLDLFVKSIGNSVHWVPGDAVFMTGTPNVVPHAMLHNIKHNKVLHQRNILVTVVIEDVPFVAPEERITTETLAEHFFRIKIFTALKMKWMYQKRLCKPMNS